jgi:pSer/pThr/pTyr-binding forkhead associated (FHA) protein
MMQLAIIGSDRPFIWLVEPYYRIGKDNTCDIKLADETLQGVHVQLNVDGDKLTLVPSGSVSVNGTQVRIPCPVTHGDRLELGATQLQIIDPKVAAQASRSPSSTAAPDGESWMLHGLSTALSDKRYPIQTPQIVGRGQHCDIFLGVAHLSRQHARLSIDDKGLLVEDLDSANGTFVNGKRIIGKSRLKSGDELCFDTLRFRVQAPGAAIDLDKTMMRPAAQSPATKPVRNQASASGRAARQLSRAGNPEPRPAAEAEISKTAPTSANQRWWLLGGLLLLAFGVVWILKNQMMG